jgi:hypothetical protein
VARASGPREETLAEKVVATTQQRTTGRVGIPYVSDGWEPYAATIRATYRDREPSGIRPGWDILRPTGAVTGRQVVVSVFIVQVGRVTSVIHHPYLGRRSRRLPRGDADRVQATDIPSVTPPAGRPRGVRRYTPARPPRSARASPLPRR